MSGFNKRELCFWMFLVLAILGIVFGIVRSRQDYRPIHPDAQAAVKSVKRAQLWVRLKGGYWENKLEEEAAIISSLPVEARLDFFREIILTSELDTSRATLFTKLIGNDVDHLRQHLIRFKSDPSFRKLSEEQVKELDAWISQLEIIEEVNGAWAP